MSEESNAWQTKSSSIIQWSATFHNREAENTVQKQIGKVASCLEAGEWMR